MDKFYLVGFLLVLSSLSEYTVQVNLKETGNRNLRVCVVEGKGLYKKAGRYCPVLEKSNNGVECVIGIDRLDCLRRISKGSVDFGAFSSEDLLAARWQNIDVLVTDELRFHNEPFEYEVVAIIDKRYEVSSLGDLRGSRLCHPGHGYEADWTDTLANFLESRVIPRSCDPTLSLFENRLKASSEFFSAACKAGPWVADRARDRILKSLYPSLCSLCYNPELCSSGDKYWGRRGPLHCLTEEAGDIAWARLDDTKIHFGLSGVPGIANPSDFLYLCSDGTTKPLRNSTAPCVWIAKPWPVIAAKRQTSAAVSALASTLNHQFVDSWQSALLSLIEFYHVRVIPLYPQIPVQDYLQRAIGFDSANSFAECNPPRSVVICTNSVAERHKCDWLAETARAHGLEPQLQCFFNGSSENSCFHYLKSGIAEVAIGHPDMQVAAKWEFQLDPIIYEMTPIMNDLYVVVAVVKNNSNIKTFKDMSGKKACFPNYNGVAWHSVINFFKSQKLFTTSECPYEDEMASFFDEACVPGLKGHDKLTKLCGQEKEYDGEIGALKCLVDGVADVSFIGLTTLKNISNSVTFERWARNIKFDDFRTICPPQYPQGCYLSWSTIGQLYVRANTSTMRRQELINTFKQLDQMFGKNYKFQTSAFMMYGSFDHKNNVLFQDRTKYMRTFMDLTENRLPLNYEVMMKEYKYGLCEAIGSAYSLNASRLLLILSITYLLVLSYVDKIC